MRHPLRLIGALLLALPAAAWAAGSDPSGMAAADPVTLLEQRFRLRWPQAGSLGGDAPVEVRIDALAADGRHWDAALLAARHLADAGDAPDAAALLAREAARAGLTDTARAALAAVDRASRDRRSDAVLAVARHLHEAGQPEAALATLEQLPLRLRAKARNGAAQLEARVLLALGRARDAAQVLQGAQFDPLLLIGDPLDDRLEAGLLQYNLALALIRSGDAVRGRSLLDRLGKARDPEPEMQAVRDRANLALAAHFLNGRQGATARALFERVTLEGPYSSRALLGMGWASLAAQGQGQRGALDGDRSGSRETPRFVLRAMQRRRLIDCSTFNRRALAPTELCLDPGRFERAGVPSEPEGLALEALAVWGELAEREPRDPAVREAWAALGHAAARAGLRAEAIGHYEAAAVKLEAALADNAAAAARLAADGIGAAVGEAIAAAGLPPGAMPSAAGLARFEARLGLDAAPGRGGARPLLETLALARWLLADDPADPEATALADAAMTRLAAFAEQVLDAERRQLIGWLGPVRAALATLTDPSFVLPAPGTDPERMPG
jgi:hypothetical protein